MLKGKDAIRFEKKMRDAKKNRASSQEIALARKAHKDFGFLALSSYH